MVQTRHKFEKEWLEEKYINQNLSLKEIAEIKKCGISTVSRAVKTFSLKNKKGLVKNKYGITKKFLQEEYVSKKRSQAEIANSLSCDQTLVYYYIKLFNIQTRASTDFFHFKGHPLKGKANKWGKHSKETKTIISKLSSGKNNAMWGKTLTKEHKNKLSVAFSGKKNPMWGKRGKKSPNYKPPHKRRKNLYEQIRNSYLGKTWTQSCYARDNFTCQNCGDNKGGNLNAHHILSLSELVKKNEISTLEKAIKCSELWDIKNGVTLCKPCHINVHKTAKSNNKVKNLYINL